MTIHRLTLPALGLAALALGPAACMERTIRPVRTSIMTQGEAEARLRERERAADEPLDPVEEAERQLARDPGSPRWNFELGRYYEARGDLPLAEARYRAGLAGIDAGVYTGPHLFLGRVLAKQGRFEEALPHLQQVVAIKPPTAQGYYLNAHYAQAYYLLGVARYRLHREVGARDAFERYLRLGGERRHVVTYFPDMIAPDF